MKVKSMAITMLRVAVTLSIIIILVRKVNFTGLGRVLRDLNITFFLSALGLSFFAQVLNAVRWKIILSGLETKVSLVRLIYLQLVGIFFNAFMPTSIGGEAIKAYYLSRLTGKSADSVSSVIAVRLIGLFSLLLLAGLGLGINYYHFKSTAMVSSFGIIFAIVSSGLLLVVFLSAWILKKLSGRTGQSICSKKVTLLKKISDYGEKLFLSFDRLKKKRYLLLVCVLISLAFNLTLISVNYFIARALNLDIAFFYFLIFIPLISLFLMLPVSISGIGLRESAYVFLFTKVGATPAQALSISLVGYGLVLILSLLGGLSHLWAPFRIKKQVDRSH